ncbi:MAG: hypothetical protein ACR2RE_05250 [Geminicoccaceae bacterium]
MGYRPDEVFGERSVNLLTDESHRLARDQHLPALMKYGTVNDVAYDAVSKSGAVISVASSAVIERDAFGAHTRTIVNIRRR